MNLRVYPYANLGVGSRTSREAIRIESDTLRALREPSSQSGEPIVRLAQRYIGEGMRLDGPPEGIGWNSSTGRSAPRLLVHQSSNRAGVTASGVMQQRPSPPVIRVPRSRCHRVGPRSRRADLRSSM
jgi:hypothetical protein